MNKKKEKVHKKKSNKVTPAKQYETDGEGLKNVKKRTLSVSKPKEVKAEDVLSSDSLSSNLDEDDKSMMMISA